MSLEGFLTGFTMKKQDKLIFNVKNINYVYQIKSENNTTLNIGYRNDNIFIVLKKESDKSKIVASFTQMNKCNFQTYGFGGTKHPFDNLKDISISKKQNCIFVTGKKYFVKFYEKNDIFIAEYFTDKCSLKINLI